MINKRFVVSGCITVLLAACLHREPASRPARIMDAYKQELRDLSAETRKLVQLVEQQAAMPQLQQQFRKARTAYKRVEWLAEYYFPYTAKKINGPALAEVEPDEKTITIEPEGFQVVEDKLFTPGNAGTETLVQQAKLLHSNTGRLQYMASMQEITDAHIFDALRLEVFRITTLGITGFDSPVASNSLEEASAALKNMEQVLSFYDKDGSGNSLKNLLEAAIRFLSSAKDFNSFDRITCITRYLNPVSARIVLLQRELAIPFFTEPRALRADAGTLFEKAVFNADFYTPGTQSYSSPDKVALGEKLFYDGILSGDGRRSCATCHEPARAFTDGHATSFAVNGKSSLRRNAPTLLNAALQPALFYDTRVNYLEDQAKDVISNADEMHGSLENTVKLINRNAVYKALFRKVYGEESASEVHVKNSIAAYIRSLVRINSPFDRYMNGNLAAMGKLETDGFNVFAGKAKCATCHFIPLFNGTNPPAFDKIDAEVIGVPSGADSLHAVLDADKGKYNLHGIDLYRHAFKTPTLRNAALTAPYMHNGVFKTLEEVVEFYNRGGGAGLGLELPNQTLSPAKLGLSAYEKKSLVAFMKALTDTCSTPTPTPPRRG